MPRFDEHQPVVDAMADVIIDFARDEAKAKSEEPFAWCWYDAVNDRYEFSLWRATAPADAQPLYRRLNR